MAPCGFATGIDGALPQAGAGVSPDNFRTCRAAPPATATIRAKIPEKLNASILDGSPPIDGPGYHTLTATVRQPPR
jgi:hypothetical protein